MRRFIFIILAICAFSTALFGKELKGNKKLKENEGIITIDTMYYCNTGTPYGVNFYIEDEAGEIVEKFVFKYYAASYGGSDQWGYRYLYVIALPAGTYTISKTRGPNDGFTPVDNKMTPVTFEVKAGENHYLGKLTAWVFDGRWNFVKRAPYFALYLIANKEAMVEGLSTTISTYDTPEQTEDFKKNFPVEKLQQILDLISEEKVDELQELMDDWDSHVFTHFIYYVLDLPIITFTYEYDNALDEYKSNSRLSKISSRYELLE